MNSALDDVVPNAGTFLDQESKCRRDIGYIVDAVKNDLLNFTNKNIISATNYYFDQETGKPLSDALIGEEVETVTAFRASADYLQLAINNQLNSKNFNLAPDPVVNSNNDPDACQNVQDTIDNLIGIVVRYITLIIFVYTIHYL